MGTLIHKNILGRVHGQAHDADYDGKSKTKHFVPSSLRAKQPINHSKKVRNDSRFVIAYAIIAVTKEARKKHEEYKNNMTALELQKTNGQAGDDACIEF